MVLWPVGDGRFLKERSPRSQSNQKRVCNSLSERSCCEKRQGANGDEDDEEEKKESCNQMQRVLSTGQINQRCYL